MGQRRYCALILCLLGLGLGLRAGGPASGAAVYCNITDISFKELSNGVQIVIQADGVLEYTGYSASSSKTISGAVCQRQVLDREKFY